MNKRPFHKRATKFLKHLRARVERPNRASQFLSVLITVLTSVFIGAGFVFAAITLNQNIQIGSGSPDLTLNGNDLYVVGTFEVDGATLFDGNVGIGTTNPATALSLADNANLSLGTGADSRLYYDGTDTFIDLRATGTGDLMIALETGFPSPDPDAVHIWRGNSDGTATVGSMLILEDNATNFIQFLTPQTLAPAILFGDDDSSISGYYGYNHNLDGLIFGVNGVTRLLYQTGAFAFQEATTISTIANNNLTITAGGTGDLLLTADSDTFVGIGTNVPGSLLEIAGNETGSSVSDVVLTISNASTTAADPYIDFQTASTTRWLLGIDDSDSDKFRLTPGGAFNATSSGITIDAAGNVGIGTTGPSAELEITSTATTTLNIDSTSASQGSCLVMKDSAGVTKYVRIEGTSFVINTTSCE